VAPICVAAICVAAICVAAIYVAAICVAAICVAAICVAANCVAAICVAAISHAIMLLSPPTHCQDPQQLSVLLNYKTNYLQFILNFLTLKIHNEPASV